MKVCNRVYEIVLYADCGGIFRDAPRSINMPGYSGRPSGLVDCLWNIRAPPKHVIQLTWTNFPTRQVSVVRECGTNFIDLIEDYGTPEAKSLGKYVIIIIFFTVFVTGDS